MRVYMDMDMCEKIDISYHGEPGQVVRKTPAELIVLRGRWKGYDKKHMDFFTEFGLTNIMVLTHEMCGWFTVDKEPGDTGYGVLQDSLKVSKKQIIQYETHLKTLCTCPECGSKFFHWLEGGYDMTEDFLEMEMSTRTCEKCLDFRH